MDNQLGSRGAQARCTTLVTQSYWVVVSRQPNSISARTLTDLELSCPVRLNLVVHSLKVSNSG